MSGTWSALWGLGLAQRQRGKGMTNTEMRTNRWEGVTFAGKLHSGCAWSVVGNVKSCLLLERANKYVIHMVSAKRRGDIGRMERLKQ